ncbi:MAG: hypothetical protein KJ694_22140 [Gammaproteobacteria bacterium]|nr:hypothetical protein [Gammaproteobacteria bacterium]
MTQLIPRSEALPGTWSPVGWMPPANLSFDDWDAIGQQLGQVERAIRWLIGDWLNYGERRWGETYAQAIGDDRFSAQTLYDYAWVARQVPISARTETLSWTHHKYVAHLPAAEQVVWLKRAEAGGWSSRELQQRLKGALPAGPAPSDNGSSAPAPAPITSRAELAQARAELDAAPDPVRAAMVHTFEAALKLPTTLDAEWHECPKCGHRWVG